MKIRTGLVVLVLALALPPSALGLSARVGGTVRESHQFDAVGCGGLATARLTVPAAATIVEVTGPVAGQVLVDDVYGDEPVATLREVVKGEREVIWTAEGTHSSCDPTAEAFEFGWYTTPYRLSVQWVARQRVAITLGQLRRSMRAAIEDRLDTEWWVWNGKEIRCRRTSSTRGRCFASAWGGDTGLTARVRFRTIVHRAPYPEVETTEIVGRGRIRLDNSYCRAVGNPNCIAYLKVRWSR